MRKCSHFHRQMSFEYKKRDCIFFDDDKKRHFRQCHCFISNRFFFSFFFCFYWKERGTATEIDMGLARFTSNNSGDLNHWWISGGIDLQFLVIWFFRELTEIWEVIDVAQFNGCLDCANTIWIHRFPIILGKIACLSSKNSVQRISNS